jgi:hypothetical protein
MLGLSLVASLEPAKVCISNPLPNVSLQLTSARSKEAIAVEWLDGTQTYMLVSRLVSRSLATELGR